jgi:ATP-binding cassette, sub-family E, member 1
MNPARESPRSFPRFDSAKQAIRYLDSEQRIVAARVIKRFIMHAKKTAFVVEHDFIMATYLADRVIVFEGQPAVKSKANAPESLLTGCNKFLKSLDVTFRRDPNSYRPRINKHRSQLDQEQKLSGNYVSELLFSTEDIASH